MIKLVEGLQWGDEGKGKIVDWLVGKEGYDIVARWQGGANAGHTVWKNGKKFVLHLIPSGILHKDVKCVLGNGMVVNPVALFDEIEELKKKGIKVEGRLFISDRCHVTFDFHLREEKYSEEVKGKDKIDSTLRGIGPTYHDKFGRIGIRMCDFINKKTLVSKLEANLEKKNWMFRFGYGKLRGLEEEIKALLAKDLPPEQAKEKVHELFMGYGKERCLDKEKIIAKYLELSEKIRPFVHDTSVFLNDAIREGENILCEGAQGTLLDVDHGTYPYVTSSNPVAGGACVGLGIGPTKIDQVIGVAKAYTTRVGAGPFPTEQDNQIGEKMREIGEEYGATTGRPRRCGWFDAVAVRHSVTVSGANSLVITKLDVLDEFETLRICTGYVYKGKFIDFPAQIEILEEVKPIYLDLSGWEESTRGIRRIEDLPPRALDYLAKISVLTATKISFVSVGPKESQIAVRFTR